MHLDDQTPDKERKVEYWLKVQGSNQLRVESCLCAKSKNNIQKQKTKTNI